MIIDGPDAGVTYDDPDCAIADVHKKTLQVISKRRHHDFCVNVYQPVRAYDGSFKAVFLGERRLFTRAGRCSFMARPAADILGEIECSDG